MTTERVSSVRLGRDTATLAGDLGFLAELGGSWHGDGFNLIGRPHFEGQAAVYLQLNQTIETLKVDPIPVSIPNRGFLQNDIELYGLTYLQKIKDASTGSGLHVEPGIWIRMPATTGPPESPPAGGQMVARMASIPHGNAVLAQGAATPFTGVPTLPEGTDQYAGSVFPSFNSGPFPSVPGNINAAGSSEALTAQAAGAGAGFPEYDLTVAASNLNPRTPFATDPPQPALPAQILEVPMQEVINDPISLLQAKIRSQVADGHSFEGVALNIATQPQLTFLTTPNAPAGPNDTIDVPGGEGGVENTLFLEGGAPAGPLGPNALTSTVYATFWIERVTHRHRPHFMQLQYAQMTLLTFGVLNAPAGTPVFSWPHVSVATLKKSL